MRKNLYLPPWQTSPAGASGLRLNEGPEIGSGLDLVVDFWHHVAVLIELICLVALLTAPLWIPLNLWWLVRRWRAMRRREQEALLEAQK
jgi:hypothetical protein